MVDLKTDKEMCESVANRMLFCLDTRVEGRAKYYAPCGVSLDETRFLPVETTETLSSSSGEAVRSLLKRESVRQARARMVEECAEEDSHALFKKLFADEHIRPTSDADLRKAEEFREKFEEDEIADLLRQRFIESSLSADQIDRLKNGITVLEDVSWKDVVYTLHNLEQSIYHQLWENSGYVFLPAEIKKPLTAELFCFEFGVDDGEIGKYIDMLATFEPMNLVSSDYPGYFETDLCKHVVGLRHAQVAHQVERLYHENGTISPNMKAKNSYRYDFDRGGLPPSMGMFVCLKEGLCVWNSDEERYELVYPISAMRSLLYSCKERLLEETLAAEEEMRRFFDQELVIDYRFQSYDEIAMAKSNPTDFVQSVKVQLRQFELRVVSASFVASVGEGSSILRVHCIRDPQWDVIVIERINIENAVLVSAYEQYAYWKKQCCGRLKAREYLNYHRRRSLVLNHSLLVQMPLSKEAIFLQKISLQVVDRSVLGYL